MSEYIYLFDLDSTIPKKEILPTISKKIGKFDEMKKITEATMRGEIPFEMSFLHRVDLLSKISVSQVSNIVENIPLNTELVKFICKNKERCFIVTGNLDIWITKLMQKLDLMDHVYCSKAQVKDDKIEKDNINEIYLLGSEGTTDSKVYQNALDEKSIKCLVPSKEEYQLLRECIEAVKQNNYTDEAKKIFLDLVNRYDSCILGCTELPILYDKYKDEITCKNVYDPVLVSLAKLKGGI